MSSCSSLRCCQTKGYSLFEEVAPFDSPLRGGWEVAAPSALHELVQLFALLPDKGGILFPKRLPLLIPPSRGGVQRAALHELVQLFALLPDKGSILFPKRIPPLEPPEKGEGSPPRPPDIGSLQLEGLHALRSVSAVYVASPRTPAFRYRYQPRPTSWGASDGSLAADCGGGGGIAALAAF